MNDIDYSPGSSFWDAGEELEELIDQLEEGWRLGCPPELDELIPRNRISPNRLPRSLLLRELALTDMEHRIRRGEAISIEALLRRFPELAPDAESFAELVRRSSPKDARWPEAAAQPQVVRRAFRGFSPAHGASPDGCAGAVSLPSWLGKFRLLERLNVGPAANVYRAFDCERRCEVAVKIALAESAEQANRFDREVWLAEWLRHPNIVPALEVGCIQGSRYLSFKMMRGGTLRDRLSRERLPNRAAAAAVARIADALDHVHREGVVHCDVKPTNILLDEDNHAFLADFGLSQVVWAGLPKIASETMIGTPAFMSPEQAAAGVAGGGKCGDQVEIDGRSDVFSLGVVLYELLSGRLPFQGRGRMLLQQIIEDQPPPIGRFCESVPAALECICMKAMSKVPADRYPFADAMAADLRECLLRGGQASRLPR